ncbi:MAG: 50S ribosomal protein L11 [Candidatus Zambryskibacteria bacterium RIFCSPLOWO2_02_FULL_39_26]|uniref:Large ribosomal subunit protein uL11 n=1 Tax=Candidatus Zambryskibacteria bacterium RIFCSPLOWO2_12_FULL_39_23 TaxID=1802776 RepID=A0A1G2UR62_9BACT|nr:MAG: 50S ribosomal protein L11 [Candidatus Zambryskibacteria bacterium RIFCSPHIGHO2_02_39_10]OHB00236.1 MAG: 50S ribosomal protein L11 [Candidatus Zambryskibacteria bacterium RIFCSPHIGHO2_12_FULL_39_47]OHB10055.1 MAG: 50S ribosomal protein L11 [Candidatus Zambryskibacteria bacterium RIFCSPLOWO2_02_FULL_39_26]OHB11885.1 MAG: 50S ribosomal protein L11 [Candidatus Zambryskibacteria bacterium RIFCSPLOWO2_12_FULL_39_23]
MAKKVTKKLKLILPGGKATPAPPAGPILGQAGVNIGEFVKQFNDASAKMVGDLVPVVVSVFEDRTFTFVLKTPPTTDLIKKALKIEKGSGKNTVSKAGTLSKTQLKEIAERKLPDLNANDVDAAMKIVAGSARSMGIDVK